MPAVTEMPRRPPETAATGREFRVSNFKPFSKNTLVGFVSLELPSGLILHGCTLHQKGDSRWVGLPAQKYVQADGSTGYVPVVEFASREARDRFTRSALHALDAAEVTR